MQAHGGIVLGADCLFWVFWLACAAAMSEAIDDWGGQRSHLSNRARLVTAVIFSWFTW